MEQPNYWQRLARKRVSRRNVLLAGGTAALGGAAALVVGCKSSSNGSGPSRVSLAPGSSPRSGGDVTFGRLLNVGGIDPHIDLTGLDIDAQLYSYLYSWDPYTETQIFNNYATAFEQPDPEHLQFIFELRPGVKIQPGGPGAGEDLTSDDVRSTFKRRGTSLTAPDKRFPFKIGGTNDLSKLPAALDSVIQTTDANHFSFTMQEPFVPSIREIANPTWAIVPRKVSDKYQLQLGQKAFGSGPFMLEEFKGSERIKLRRHPDYFLKPRPWADTLTYLVITEGSSLLAAFKSGQHDVNGAILTKKEFDDMKDDPNFTVARAPTLFYPCIQFKMARPPFDDKRVREAIDLAINRDEFIDNIWDKEGQYNGPIQWPQFNWALPQDELRTFYKFDLDLARQKMKEAGLEPGFDVKMKIPAVSGAAFIADAASLIKNQLQQLNIRVTIEEVEVGTFIVSVILSGNFEMTFFPNLPYDEPDRPLSFYHTRGVTGTGNWTNYTNPDLDKIIDAQSSEFDPQKRKDLIYQAQRIMINEHGPQITLPSGYAYSARWSYVHFPFEIGQATPKDTGPYGADIWTEKVS